ncbi:MAG: RagB/SusD family nutrient uptake outer membrane protein [Sphingobacteriaceae bacterium]|nr:MAG: RagB/SusD family nutrient uptake outer membrane protein [Sphingobacteriaceae bacterium]
MKSYKIFTVVFLLSCLIVSCKKNYLDRAPGIALDEEKVFSDPVQAARFADNAYNYLINDYIRFNDHRGSTSQASDEAVSGNSESSVTTLNRGLYHDHSTSASLNDMRDVWAREYAGIAITNKTLNKISAIPVAAIFPAARVEGEMRFLRAFFYFELIKRFGGVPLIIKVYDVNDDINLPRSTYDECVNFILADLEKAVTLLQNDADYGPSNYGRATKGAALALKARVLLYAASPLNNPTNDKVKWKAAADAAKEVIELSLYSLQATYTDLLNVPSSTEYIMIKVRGPRAIDGIFADYAMSPGSGGAQGQMDPTQNHVDLYEMAATGKGITEAGSGYNPQQPYVGRDPRFYANILYNGAPWQGKTIETWAQYGTSGNLLANGKDYNPNSIIYTATRYYCKKYWPEVYNRIGGTSGTTLFNYVFFRYGEVLLNYAEALNESDGPVADVYNSINQIRKRAGMPNLPASLDQTQMRNAVRHERAIELAFEDHRWYDIMRWKNGPDIVAKPIYGMNVIKNTNGTFTYTPVLLSSTFQKVYFDYMHRYPIPKVEIYKSKGILVQNPGWE